MQLSLASVWSHIFAAGQPGYEDRRLGTLTPLCRWPDPATGSSPRGRGTKAAARLMSIHPIGRTPESDVSPILSVSSSPHPISPAFLSLTPRSSHLLRFSPICFASHPTLSLEHEQRKHPMQLPVFFLAGEELQVGDCVVFFVEVDVVDDFGVIEEPTEVFFHHESMLEDSAISVGFGVGGFVLEPVAFVVFGFFGFELLAGLGAVFGIGVAWFLELPLARRAVTFHLHKLTRRSGFHVSEAHRPRPHQLHHLPAVQRFSHCGR